MAIPRNAERSIRSFDQFGNPQYVIYGSPGGPAYAVRCGHRMWKLDYPAPGGRRSRVFPTLREAAAFIAAETWVDPVSLAFVG